MMNDITQHPVYSKNVLELITVANDYCITMSKIDTTKKSWLIGYLQKICPLLYLKASLLPVIEVQNPEANERFLTQEEWEFLFNQLRNKFTDNDEFWYIDLSAAHRDPVKGSIAECLSDIYQDLKDFITLYQKTTLDAKENAVFEVRDSFEKRWGYLLVDVHKALHHIIMNTRQEEEPDDSLGVF
jgi:hypothetical protein